MRVETKKKINDSKNKVSLLDAFTKENILRALKESTDDQRKVFKK